MPPMASMRFYVVDPGPIPVVQIYMSAFPDLFEPVADSGPLHGPAR